MLLKEHFKRTHSTSLKNLMLLLLTFYSPWCVTNSSRMCFTFWINVSSLFLLQMTISSSTVMSARQNAEPNTCAIKWREGGQPAVRKREWNVECLWPSTTKGHKFTKSFAPERAGSCRQLHVGQRVESKAWSLTVCSLIWVSPISTCVALGKLFSCPIHKMGVIVVLVAPTSQGDN